MSLEEIIRGAHHFIEVVEQEDERFALEGAEIMLADLTARVKQRQHERSMQVVPLRG